MQRYVELQFILYSLSISIVKSYHIKGIILHLLATLSLPNLFADHCFVESATAPRETAVNITTVKMVLLSHAPSGAARIDKAR